MDIAWVKHSCGLCRATSLAGIGLLLWVSFNASSYGMEEGRERLEQRQAGLVYTDRQGQRQRSLPVYSQVEMQVSGLTNRVTLSQTFVNQSNDWVNGQYLFPLPNEAAVDSMRLEIGDRIIEGVIQEKRQARRAYTKAKQAGKKASLVEQLKPNIFSAEVANLAPNESVVVTISYQQRLDYQDGRFSLRFPMIINPRYTPSVDQGAYAQLPLLEESSAIPLWRSLEAAKANLGSVVEQLMRHSELQYLAGSQALSPLDGELTIHLDTGFELEQLNSVYHPISQSMRSDGSLDIRLQAISVNRDFVLEWQAAVGLRPEAAMYVQQGATYQPHNAEDYALLMLMPPQADVDLVDSIARELILVIDTSGSMSGASISQARQALLQALAGLQPQDRFNIIEFNSHYQSFSEGSVAATKQNLDQARHFVNRLDANGGTEMLPALAAALTPPPSNEPSLHLRQVIFITDGAVSNEPQLFELINNHLGESRLFTIGIGSAPNSHFMQRAAELGKGTFTYIGQQSEVAEKMTALLRKISRPVVSDVQLRYADGSVPDYWPATIPDLYLGQPLLVSIKLAKDSQTQLLVSGNIGHQPWQRHLNLQANKQAAGLDLLWARQQIAALELSKNGANDQRVQQQVLALALNYHLVSSQTSLVAVDISPSKPQAFIGLNKKVVSGMPASWKNPQGRLPQTATASRLSLSAGLLLLLLSVLLWQWPPLWMRAKR